MDNICNVPIEKCCGCESCFNACSTKAISIEENELGFVFPVVDSDKCILCGKCLASCPAVNNKIEKKEFAVKAYAYKHNNINIRKNSSSGGFFTSVAEYVLNKKGIVFGAVFDNDWHVIHSYINDKNELWRLNGSKYVQSDIGVSFVQVREFLDDGRIVLFSGTPCQIEGLKLFLNKDYQNLITVCVICHGIPSSGLWNKYIKELIQENGKIIDISFRNNLSPWPIFKFFVTFFNGKYFCQSYNDNQFLSVWDNGLRESCTHCAFKGYKHNCDFQIGDFDNIEEIVPEFKDYYGVSEVLVESKKGEKIFNALKADKKAVELEAAVKANKMINHSMTSNWRKEYYSVYKNYRSKDLAALKKEFMKAVAKEEIGKLRNKNNLYIWGTGQIGAMAADAFNEFGISYNGFIVTKKTNTIFYNHKVLSFDEMINSLANQKFSVILGVSYKYFDDITPMLEQYKIDYVDANSFLFFTTNGRWCI